MTEKNLSEAIKNILEKELKNFSKLIPNDVLKNIGKNVSPQIENMIETNIRSEGLIKGVIQVPGDGNPIVMLSDYGTIGGYPKIGVVISADHDRLVQLSPGSKIKFKLVELSEAENLYKLYEIETKNILNQIR